MLLLVNVILTLCISWAHGGGNVCEYPDVKHGKLYEEIRNKQQFPVAMGKYLFYTCDHSFVSPSKTLWTQITCTNKGWEPTPKCLRQCFLIGLENGAFTSMEPTHHEGDTIQISCNKGYSFPINKGRITCTESGWSSPPICSSEYACVVTEEILKKHNIRFKWSGEKLLYSTSGDHVEFACRPGHHNVSPLSAFRVQCVDGKMEYPTCA